MRKNSFKIVLRQGLICLLLGVAGFGLVSCSSTDDEMQVEESVDTLYNRAMAAMQEENYVEATKYFDEVERQHPYSQWANKAQLMAAYSSYLDQRYDEAVIALDRFIELHPGHKDIAYAHYLKALCFYEQISDVRRDQQMTQLALDAMETLIQLYPDSRYARDAKLKRDLTYDHLAGKEMEIGRYYLKRDHINAAINRFKEVIKKYETTTHTPEALHRLVEAYMTLGLREEALRVAAVLGYNYPGNKWYERSYKLLDDQARKTLLEQESAFKRTIDSLLAPE